MFLALVFSQQFQAAWQIQKRANLASRKINQNLGEVMKTTRILLTAVALCAGLAATFMPGAASAQSPVAVATGLINPGALAIDGDYIYFSETGGGNGFLSRALKSGGPREQLISNRLLYDSGSYRGIDRIAFSPTHIYYGYGGYVNYRIEELPRGGSSARLLSSPSGGGFMGLIGSNAYYFKNFCCLQQLDIAPGATPQQVATGVWPRGQAPDDTSLYFVDFSSKTVYRHDAGTANALVPLISGNASEGSVFLDSANVYLSVGGIVRKTPKLGGSVTNIIMPSGAAVKAVHDAFIYFTVGNQLWRKAVMGDIAEELVIDGVSIAGMVADANFLYWGDHSGGAGNGVIYRLQKAPPSVQQNQSRAEIQSIQVEPSILVDQPLVLKRKAVVLTHGWNSSVNEWPKDMAKKIRDLIDQLNEPNVKWDVHYVDWSDAAASGIPTWPWNKNWPWEARTNAGSLGKQLADKLALFNYDHIHFIAHSAGSNLIETAALQLKRNAISKLKTPVIYSTFFDAFDPNGTDSLYGFSSDWAEQYVDKRDILTVLSNTNLRLPGAFNFIVNKLDQNKDYLSFPSCIPLSNNFKCEIDRLKAFHAWPWRWYRSTIENPAGRLYGFPLATEYRGGYTSNNLYLAAFPRNGKCTLLSDSLQCLIDSDSSFPEAVSKLVSQPWSSTHSLGDIVSSTGTALIVRPTLSRIDLNLTTGSPVWASLAGNVTQGFNTLQFSYAFTSQAEGLLSVFLDDQVVFKADERHANTGVNTSGPISLGNVAPGVHTLSFRLDHFSATPSSIEITNVGALASSIVRVTNQVPQANAGATQTVRLGSQVRLDGAGSADPDQKPLPLTYDWIQTAGPAISLFDAATTKPTFTPPTEGQYVFSLTVNDGQSNSNAATVMVRVPILGDIDVDGDVDTNDLARLTAALNKPASSQNDLRDLDGDGKITALDSRKLVTLCTRLRCATQ